MTSKMSKRLGVSLAFMIAILAIPMVVGPANASATIKGTAVYDDQGQEIGRDPDPFIRLMLLRDLPGTGSDSSGD